MNHGPAAVEGGMPSFSSRRGARLPATVELRSGGECVAAGVLGGLQFAPATGETQGAHGYGLGPRYATPILLGWDAVGAEAHGAGSMARRPRKTRS